ncbi:AAA family ATPase [Actinophytocola oryzae]|uniref:Putative ATPase n=1 Tax=Actinophytocola oryzae TaxID=502181 RepID=A0A4R7VHZ2_9PSEU|nr:AAA family ATPase [Actinophytocola oryzae]TDV48984.1 putative ATPase [Actinophytocola oryzae]
MSSPDTPQLGIERLRIRNYRVLRDVTFEPLTSMTALVGANGTGKSTVFDALRFLQQAVSGGLAAPWDERGGLAEIRSREAVGPVEIELTCRIDLERFHYRLAVDEDEGTPVVRAEELTWEDTRQPVPGAESLLSFNGGTGTLAGSGSAEPASLSSPDVLAVAVFGQLDVHPHIVRFRRFVTRCRLSNLDIERIRAGNGSSRKTARLSTTGDNLATVVLHLRERKSEVWEPVIRELRRYVPGLADVVPERLGDGRDIVRIKEEGADEPILPVNISEGTLKLLGYLVALREPASVLLLEEPENQVHPRLHYLLAEAARSSAESGQVIVATHSPRLVDAMRPEEVWVLYRAEDGYAQAQRAADMPRLVDMVEAGGALGDLWTEGYFSVGDPLTGRS